LSLDSNNYCPGEYLYNCGSTGISEYCYYNEETGTDSNDNQYNINASGFNWAETWGTDNILAYLTGVSYASTI
jgi:hypothetical protein